MLEPELEHAKLSPSAAERWMSCPGSIRLSEGIKDVSSSYAEEGTLAHKIAEECLTKGLSIADIKDCDEDMRHHIGHYLTYVYEVMDGKTPYAEVRLDLGDWIANGFGTADVVGIRNTTLVIIDLKYGIGKVSAIDNPQLKLYALGALAKASKYKITDVELHIAQPRINNWSKYIMSPSELLEFGEDVKVKAELCFTDNAPLNPSEKACQWCRAKATCPALYEHNVKIVGDDFKPLSPERMTDAQLKLVLDNKVLIEKWLKSVEGHVFDMLKEGGTFEGYKVVAGRSVRSWAANAEEVLVKMLGNDAYERKLIGITTAEKVIGKKHLNELGITLKPEGKPTLVSVSDKREAINVLSDFSTIKN